MNLKLLSYLILRGSDDLKSDLQGQLRSLRPKMSFFLTFQFGYFDNTTFSYKASFNIENSFPRSLRSQRYLRPKLEYYSFQTRIMKFGM